MSGCKITGGIVRDCSMTTGGISEIAFANLDDILSVTKDADGVVTDIEMKAGTSFYKFEFEKNTGSANQPLQVGTNKYILPAVAFTSKGYTQEAKLVMEKLAVGVVVSLVRMRGSGNWFLFGEVNGLESSALEGNSGAAEGDTNGFVVTMTGVETAYAPQVDSALVDTLIIEVDEPVILNFEMDATTISNISNVGSEAFTINGTDLTGATALVFVNTSTLAEEAAGAFSVDSATVITGTTAAMAAGTYQVKVTTPVGSFQYPVNLTVV